MAVKWTNEKVKAQKLAPGIASKRIAVGEGLYLFVRRGQSGLRKQWQYRAQVDGVRRWLSLGRYPGVGLKKAWEELAKHQAALEEAKKGQGDHPALVARNERKSLKARPTVKEAFAEWIADKRRGSSRKGGKPVRERTIGILEQNYNADIRDRVGDMKIATVGSFPLRACIDAPRDRKAPGAAAQVYRVLRGLFNFAIERGYVEVDPMRGIKNPRPYRPQPVVAANEAELSLMLQAVEKSRMWSATKLALEFHLLTGARPSEVRLATWGEFDLKRAVWTLPSDRVKSDRPFRIHLSSQALSLLERARRLPRHAKEAGVKRKLADTDFVFPGSNGAAMEKMAIARALSRLAKRTEEEGGKKLRPHDLRRTFRTMLSRLGVMPHIAELCMNHQETETMRRVYDGHDYWEDMVSAWNKAAAQIALLKPCETSESRLGVAAASDVGA